MYAHAKISYYFFEVSVAVQSGRKLTVFLQLSGLETTTGFFGNVKLKNADLPICKLTPE